MGHWGYETKCGTVTCAAGHCGLDPWFRRRGFKLNFDDYAEPMLDDEDFNVSGFFGHEGARDIFFDSHTRPVSTVIREVRAHIKWLENAA
jgi:hypothetical protein